MASSSPAEELARGKAFLRTRWPRPRILLLADVALAPEDVARSSWAQWLGQSDLDTTPWAEIRAIAASAERIAQLAPDTPDIGRIKGFRRFIFINGQRTFATVRPMLAALSEAGVDFMLLKGAARIASDSSAAAARFVGDVDVLVRFEQRERAWQVARERNWHLNRKLSPMSGGTWEGQSSMSHALEFTPSPDIDKTVLDLHHYSRSLCRNLGDDDAMWANARRGRFLGLDVWLPSPTDQLRHTLTHALMHASHGRPIDWVFDSAELLSGAEIDWNAFANETMASSTQALVGSAALLLKERLSIEVPDAVIERLIGAITPALAAEYRFRTSAYYRDTSLAGLLPGAVAAATMRADAAAHRQGTEAMEPPRPAWTRQHADGPTDVAPGAAMGVFPVPPDLRSGELVQLEVRVRARDRAGMVSIQVPSLPVIAWKPSPRSLGKRRTRSVSIAANLLLMTRSRLVGIRWTGEQPLDEVEVHWIRRPPIPAALDRLRQRAIRLTRDVRRRLSSR